MTAPALRTKRQVQEFLAALAEDYGISVVPNVIMHVCEKNGGTIAQMDPATNTIIVHAPAVHPRAVIHEFYHFVQEVGRQFEAAGERMANEAATGVWNRLMRHGQSERRRTARNKRSSRRRRGKR